MVIIMTLKKIKIINVVFLFLLSFLWHFMYDLFPNNLFALVFPVNESIWEHMKIIYYCLLLGSILEFVLCKKNNIIIWNLRKEKGNKTRKISGKGLTNPQIRCIILQCIIMDRYAISFSDLHYNTVPKNNQA